ncbi:hypothetical protein LTR95_007789 [Oleoguttula sp. CCFEE 5521]
MTGGSNIQKPAAHRSKADVQAETGFHETDRWKSFHRLGQNFARALLSPWEFDAKRSEDVDSFVKSLHEERNGEELKWDELGLLQKESAHAVFNTQLRAQGLAEITLDTFRWRILQDLRAERVRMTKERGPPKVDVSEAAQPGASGTQPTTIRLPGVSEIEKPRDDEQRLGRRS